MKLYERFGISASGIDPSSQMEIVENGEMQLEKGASERGRRLHGIAWDCGIIALRFYLMDDYQMARTFATKTMSTGMRYFFGDWRSQDFTDKKIIDPGWWHDMETWMDLFSLVLLWGSVLEDWTVLERLATYADDRRALDCDLHATPALRQLYLEIAEFLRTGGKIQSRVPTLSGANRRGVGILAGRISAKDKNGAEQAINEFFKQHHKRKKSDQIADTISVDGTIILNLARHGDLEIKLDPKFEHYFVKFP